MYRLLFFTLLALILIRPLITIYEQRDQFLSLNYNDTYEDLSSDYYNSQYVKKDNPKIITDEQFEEFAGGAFLRGLNPILITHDHPPLGRYIVSLSILFFNNAKLIVVPLLMVAIIGLFIVARKILKSNLLSLIPIALFVNEPLFYQKLVYVPIPEAILFPFIIWCIYFYIRLIEEDRLKFAFLGSLFLGFVISVRVFTVGMAIAASVLATYILIKKFNKSIINFLISLPIALGVLAISYTKTIIESGNPLVFLGVQKYILDYHSSKFILPFTFWDLILFNRWHTWWGDWAIVSDDIWMITWPISIVIVIVTLIYRFVKKEKIQTVELVILLFLLMYCGMLSLSYTSTRYFMPIIPFLYILSVKGLIEFKRIYYKKKK